MAILLKKGMTLPVVKELQAQLTIRGYPVAETGVFDTPTYNAVRAFQSQNVDSDGSPLTVDGIVGELTWAALGAPKRTQIIQPAGVDFTTMPDPLLGGSVTGRNGLAAAIAELNEGAGEVGGNNDGPWVNKYLNGGPPGSSWCAAFVSWCLKTGNNGNSPIPYSLGARKILSECKKRGYDYAPSTGHEPLPGDLVVWWRVQADGWQGHIGFVYQVLNGKLYTIEGNKTSKVQGFSYTLSKMDKLLGFCRLP